MLPPNKKTREMILESSENGMAVAELEYLGLSTRVISILEDKFDIVYLKDLINTTEEELTSVGRIGTSFLNEIKRALKKFPQLEETKLKWHKASDRLYYYQTTLKTKDFF